MTVASYLRYVSEVKRIPRGRRTVEAERVMERCGLAQMARRSLGNLSKGYRQRVGLAQALLGNPPVLILDEPTVGLDPKQIVDIRRTIRDLAEEHTVLLSTHILPEVSMVCDRVLIINRGRVVAQDTMANLEGAARAPEYEVEVGGATEAAISALSGLTGVTGVERTAGECFRLACASDTGPLAGTIAEAVSKAGLTLLGVRKRTRSLEDVFISAISEDGVAAESVSA
jgi:ABC-2 type transport system ATP-binding protein